MSRPNVVRAAEERALYDEIFGNRHPFRDSFVLSATRLGHTASHELSVVRDQIGTALSVAHRVGDLLLRETPITPNVTSVASVQATAA